ncbi:FadR family transcriptional regulator [Baekduia soli]|uniref:Pyruvate dehydrogenase complex repressor n=1 Tax=Baekduia soli TaxID=496014 RepID=A0A5B8U2U8_9ACTN|nr:FadR/GntR family transcriptional regulator [Baekduia soli]QEC47379.1 FadR family transcriptional regulator [Baekduia soli]
MTDDDDVTPRATMPRVQVRRIRKASEQVADQLRALIIGGDLPAGAKLPTEQGLATEFGVSRATVREALTGLSTEGLLRTVKGVNGGSFVTTPSPDRVRDALNLAVTLLSQTNGVTLDELLEVREYLEIPAARLAALRRTGDTLREMAEAIPESPLELSLGTQFVHNRDFHKAVLHASENTLLSIAAEPIFSVLQTRLSRSEIGPAFHRTINVHHRAIHAAIASGDAGESERQMREHLAWLSPKYRRIWHEFQESGI